MVNHAQDLMSVMKFFDLPYKLLPTRDPVGSKNLNALDASIVINFY